MRALDLAISAENPTEIACDALAVAAFRGAEAPRLSASGSSVDAALDGALTEELTRAAFKGDVGEVALLPTFRRLPCACIAVAGLGEGGRTGPSEVRRAAANVARALLGRPVVASALHDRDGGGDEQATWLSASVEGFLLGCYRFTAYRSDPPKTKLQRILLLEASGRSDEIARARARAEAEMLARDLTNEPAGVLYPEALAVRAQEIAEANDLELTVWDERELAETGFGGLLGVAKGSARPPRFIQLRYAPSDPSGRVAIVGKGVTFDSGGLSLKDRNNMEQMKTDKAGAAAVIAAMSALSKLDVRLEVRGFVPATENLPGPSAIKPGDVITHYGGRTSEVLNTDAEGRLILADALAFACEQQPDAIVDVATLTGSIIIALGRRASGLFCADERLSSELEAAAAAAGERMWPMPLFEDYRSELESNVADIKNIGTRDGGSILATLFLKDFVDPAIPWAHIDIAGTGRSDSVRDHIPKGATGTPTRTLINWIEERGS